ncbi:MAG: carbamoyl phosphate synthase small subunit, partial [Rhodospirillales bacterium]|nr:carbamoyl phosphate synthase small subunit [Rhodospirillales bacterium]
MPISVDDIIERLGGPEAAAARLGVGTEAVRKWRQARAVPTRHWPVLIAATGISLDDLTGRMSHPQPETSRAMTDATPENATAALVLEDGTVFWGRGFGAHSAGVPAEICFSTGMTGYQETLTDPSFAGQVITFTFPHIGNVGTNGEDVEAAGIAARGVVVKQDITAPSNWRAHQPLAEWLRAQGVAGIAGIDTRALTLRIRDQGAPRGVLAFPADGRFDT